MAKSVSFEENDAVAVVRIDDGKANALGPDLMQAIGAALDEAEEKRLAVLLLGRQGRFSAGFDLGVMTTGGPAAGRDMVEMGGRLSLRLGRFPAPVVIGCGGHALAMGAVLLLSADLRIGVDGAFKIGFNEVSIGMTTPLFLLEQARERMSKRHFVRATAQSQIYHPASAVDAGFLDRVVDAEQLETTALVEAQRLAALPRKAFFTTRSRARGAILDEIEAGLKDDVAGLMSTAAS